MHLCDPKRPRTFVSFSGIDGAGKSTQITALSRRLQDLGIRVILIRFWDDVCRLKTLRESTGHTLFKGDKGIGKPEAPIARKDKNVQSWPMTCVRLVLYFVDAVSARSSVKRALESDTDFIIYDRYCYDELANLNLQNPLIRKYVNLLLRVVPRLDRSYILDADPIQARARKPEYPLDFVYRNRAAYLQLQNFTGRMTVILPMSVDDAERAIWRHTAWDLNLPSGEDTDYFPEQLDKETNLLDTPYTHPAA